MISRFDANARRPATSAIRSFVGKFLESLALLTCDRIDRLPRLVVELNALSGHWAIPFRGPLNLPLMTNPVKSELKLQVVHKALEPGRGAED